MVDIRLPGSLVFGGVDPYMKSIILYETDEQFILVYEDFVHVTYTGDCQELIEFIAESIDCVTLATRHAFDLVQKWHQDRYDVLPLLVAIEECLEMEEL